MTIQDLLSREPGIQVTQPVRRRERGRRARSTCAASAPPPSNNTLVLINGRRINDLDLAGVDLSTLPRESIDHIEITRGNSGAVLYGDGAVGGVINIVTKTGANMPPSARIAGSFGSFKYAEGAASVNGSWGPVAASAYGNAISSDGYRQNNVLQQQNGVGDFRYTGDKGGVYLNLSADNQYLGFPGGRLVTPYVQPGRQRPARRRNSVRLRRQAGHQRHRRRHADAGARHRADRRRRNPTEEATGRFLRRRSAGCSIPMSTPRSRPLR